MVSLKNLDGNSGFSWKQGATNPFLGRWRVNLPRRVYISVRSSLQWLCRNPNVAPKSVFPWLLLKMEGFAEGNPQASACLWRWRQMQNIVCYSFWKWKGILTAVSCCIRWRKKCAPFPNHHMEYPNIKIAECTKICQGFLTKKTLRFLIKTLRDFNWGFGLGYTLVTWFEPRTRIAELLNRRRVPLQSYVWPSL